ncbi:hypothetical protein E2C01_094989 [Portunus trituberculatus]|uniref:Uncharacterized protein n=1 Tax=Portunus trituberculatus TaxID=210409 RepID=A0A5B7JZ21_PORTR|nr:hypothetical protein [Portunus trituberculatus]
MLHNPNLDNPVADESLWLRSHEISMDMHMDIEHFKGKLWHPIMEKFEKMCPGGRVEDGVCLQILEASPGPRVMKCHYPFSLLPPDMLQSAKVRFSLSYLCIKSKYHIFNIVQVHFSSGHF